MFTNALEQKSLSVLLKKYSIRLDKKKGLRRGGFAATPIDEVDDPNCLLKNLKKEEVVPFVTSKEFQEINKPHFKHIIHAYLNPESEEKPKGGFFDKFNIFRNLYPVDTDNQFLLMKKDSGILLSGSSMARLKKELCFNKDQTTEEMAKAELAKLVFDPLAPPGIQPVVDEKYTDTDLIINTYREPKWRSLEFSGTYPKAFVKLCEHLFPDEKQRRNVFSWAHHAVFNRSEISLVLLGSQGVGKTTFAYSIFSLVGLDLVTEPTGRFFDGPFNGEFSGKKFALFDEVVCKGDSHKSKLKRNMNDMIMIEGKNQTPHHVKNYMSFIFACNHARLLEIEPLDRRFYCPDLGKIRAPEEIVSEVKRGWESPQFQRDMFEMLDKEKNPDFDFFKPDKNTKSFWAMVKQGSPAPFRHVFRVLEKHEGEWVTYQQLSDTWETKRAANVLFPDFDEIANYLSDYKPMGVNAIEIDFDSYSFRYNSFGNQKEDAAEWDSL